MAVETSVTLKFVRSCLDEDGDGGAGSHSIKAELDDEKNKGKTCFMYGEKIYFNIFTCPEDMVLSLTPTDGKVFKETDGEKTIDEELIQFIKEKEASLSYPVATLIATQWMGNGLGSLAAIGCSVVQAGEEGTAIAKVKYKSNFKGYSVSLPFRDADEYPVTILIEERAT